MAATRFIDFSDLPVDKSGPHGNAWGLREPTISSEHSINLIDEAVKRATNEEICTGKHVSLSGTYYPKSVSK